jgi:hypothetical protein
MSHTESSPQSFRWSAATRAQRHVVIAASLGWMLDAFDVMLYSIVLATLMGAFSMSRTTAGLFNALTLAVGGRDLARLLARPRFGHCAEQLGCGLRALRCGRRHHSRARKLAVGFLCRHPARCSGLLDSKQRS